MQQIDIGFEEPLDEVGLSEAAYWLNFAAPQIIKFVIDPATRDAARVWLPDGADSQSIAQKVRTTISEFASSSGQQHSQDEVVASTLTESRRFGPESATTRFMPDDAVRVGAIKSLGLADVAVGEPLTTLIRALDREFLRLARKYGAVERTYSTMLPMEYLERLRYFDSFPQNIMFPSVLETDIDHARTFIQHTKNHDGKAPRGYTGFAEHTHVLAPAACFHVYCALQHEVLTDDQAITTLGRCYRYESRNASLMERLWDFQMREIVFFGQPAHVKRGREDSLERTVELAEKWELSGVIEGAHDPFFLRGGRHDYHLDMTPKYELRLDLPYKNSTFACASFNVHGTFFSSVSDICTADGEAVWTGCTAFGVERWAWAIVVQHGIDPKGWPDSLQILLQQDQA